jgi:hypothetical protein
MIDMKKEANEAQERHPLHARGPLESAKNA